MVQAERYTGLQWLAACNNQLVIAKGAGASFYCLICFQFILGGFGGETESIGLFEIHSEFSRGAEKRGEIPQTETDSVRYYRCYYCGEFCVTTLQKWKRMHENI